MSYNHTLHSSQRVADCVSHLLALRHGLTPADLKQAASFQI